MMLLCTLGSVKYGLHVRDRLLIPQVLFFSVRENGGEGVETSENLKLEEKPEENGGRGGLKQKKTCGK